MDDASVVGAQQGNGEWHICAERYRFKRFANRFFVEVYVYVFIDNFLLFVVIEE